MSERYIPFTKPPLTKKDLENVLDSLIDDELLTGAVLRSLETSFAEKIGRKYSLSCSSVSAAYHLLWIALELVAEDQVLIPSYYPADILHSLAYVGAKPVLVDFDRDGFFYQADQLQEKLTPEIKVVIIPYMFGDIRIWEQMKEMRQKRPDIHFIEDLSHVLGAQIDTDRPIGKESSAAILSLAEDSIITTGNGGLIATDNLKIFNRCRDARSPESLMHKLKRGQVESVSWDKIFDYRMADFQAALALAQLKNLNRFNARRKEIAEIYRKMLIRTSHRFLFAEDQPVSFRFPVIIETNIEEALKCFRQEKVKIGYQTYMPLHRLLKWEKEAFRRSDRFYERLIELPIYPQMNKSDINRVINALSRIV